MAIDTDAEKFSLMDFGKPGARIAYLDTTFDSDEHYSLLGLYQDLENMVAPPAPPGSSGADGGGVFIELYA